MDDLRSAGPGRRFWLAALVLSVLVAASACLTASPDPGDTPPAIQEILAQKLEPKLRRAEAQPAPYMYPSEAQEFFALKRVPAAATSIPVERYLQATDHATRMPQHSIPMDSLLPPRAEMPIAPAVAAALGGWTPLGPGNVGGRTRAILIDPLVPTTMYAAGVAGGVWKTTDGGTTWFPLADLIANIAVNSMAMDPADPNTVYAGTGEGYFNIDQVRGAGIFKTTDGGATWTHLASTNTADFHYVNKLVVSRNVPQRLYAATRTGVWRSSDGGTTWTRVHNPGVNGGCLDLALRTDQPTDYLFASCGTSVQARVYRNADAGGSGAWVSALTETNMGRTSLAIAPSNQSVVYAMAASNVSGNFRDGLHAVFRSTDSGSTWTARVRNTNPTKLNTVLLTNPVYAFLVECGFGSPNQFFNQGWYDNVLAVDPADSNRVWAGGIDLFRSDDGGSTWGLASYWWAKPPFLPSVRPSYAHADQHAIVFHPQYDGVTNKTMFVGNDGGIFRTADARATTASSALAPCDPANTTVAWTSLNNNYGVTQFYHGVPYPGGTTYFGGTQDNGTIRGSDGAGVGGWAEILTGDGGYVAVDPTNTNVLYAEQTNLSISKSTDGGMNFASAQNGITESDNQFLFIAPFTMDPSNSQRLWIGGWSMWRTTNGASSWSRASAALAGTGVSPCNAPGAGCVSAIAVTPTNPNRVLAGMSNGYINRTTSALTSTSTTTWSSALPRSGYVSSIAFHPTDENIVYATYSSFDGGPHVWRSLDGGATWAGVDGSGATAIPNIPVHTIVVDPVNTARLYVGTDIGVFVSRDGGATWAVEVTGFAKVITETLAMGSVGVASHLFAFTHGRGAWRVAIAGGVTPSISVSPLAITFPDTLVNGTSATRSVTVSNSGAGNLSVSAVTLGGTNVSQFQKTSDTCAGQVMAAGQSCTVGVNFRPTTAGTKNALLTIASNDPDAPSVTVTLKGAGTTTGRTLTVVRAGTGGGTVTSSPPGITCAPTCSSAFAVGNPVTLTAVADSNSTFAGWSGGGCGGSGTCTVTLNADTTVTATFTAATTVSLTVTIRGSATGTVTSNPAGINCGLTCSAAYAINTPVTLTATPGSGARFKGWGGACSGALTTCTVTMTAALSVTATFSQTFTDGSGANSTIAARSTVIQTAHVRELRSAIDTLRSRNSLAAFAWGEATLVARVTLVTGAHFTELRTALVQAYQAAGQTAPTFTGTITPRVAIIEAVHLNELRGAVLALE
jgi:hypothetical protein